MQPGSSQKQILDGLFASSQFNFAMKEVAARQPVLEENARVKFNYLKGIKSKNEKACLTLDRCQLERPSVLNSCVM